ncbi:translocation protein [Auricularia subglabra TFB-10046 SS5]|uniref:Translocation protein SEC62 n=1 Tax=Auricularia subglabra (strain TFB-10046 / SS5) TaxID=717982 RepID=J0DCP7_AURST|nr:translocation protein [Auricularia subglabra TFB-10046 SS5]
MEQQAAAPPEVRNLINYLRSSKSGIKNRTGVLNGKRIDYFKGKSAVKALLQPAYLKVKNAPKVGTEDEAIAVLRSALPYAFYLLVERGTGSPKPLQVVQMQSFKPDGYYAWFYEGSQLTTYLGGAAMVAVILGGVMFPLWPPIMRLGVWYLSIGLLGLIGLFFVIAIIRLIFYIITLIVASPGIWIFPQLFADVGFVESFIPLWEWDLPKKKGKKKKSKDGKEKEKAAKGGAASEGASSEKTVPVPRQAQQASIEEVEDEDA